MTSTRTKAYSLGERLNLTVVMALWLMGGVWAARIADAWPGWIARLTTEIKWVARLVMWVAIAALAATACLGLVKQTAPYPTLYMLSLETDPRAQDLYQWTATVFAPRFSPHWSDQRLGPNERAGARLGVDDAPRAHATPV